MSIHKIYKILFPKKKIDTKKLSKKMLTKKISLKYKTVKKINEKNK